MKNIVIKQFTTESETKYKIPISDIMAFIICVVLFTGPSIIELFKMIKIFWLK